MARGLVLGCLLLLLAGWLAPVPVQAMSSTRAAALWRTEAFARAAVAQAEAGDTAAAEAEPAPFYRALALVRVAEALVAADDMQAALKIVSQAQSAAQAIEVPPKEG